MIQFYQHYEVVIFITGILFLLTMVFLITRLYDDEKKWEQLKDTIFLSKGQRMLKRLEK
jgi:hypothetical protein